MRNVRSLFLLKDPFIHKVNVLYKCTCPYNDFYVGETKRNSEIGDHLLLESWSHIKLGNINKCL